MLCFYILPAFAATLKVRAKKLSASNINTTTTEIIGTSTTNSLFFDTLAQKLAGISFIRNSLVNDVNNSVNPVTVSFISSNYTNVLSLTKIKTITLFATNKNA